MPKKDQTAALLIKNALTGSGAHNGNSIASIIASKNAEVQKEFRIKQLEEHTKNLDKYREEFMHMIEEGHKKKVGQVTLFDFEIFTVLGRGSFSSVVLARYRQNKKFYAIKVMNKGQLINDNQYEHTKSERKILFAVNFPFLVKMDYCFKDNCNIFFVMTFVGGGDLFAYLRDSKTLRDKDAKFYAAQVILAIEYLHHMDVLYRDIKPENIVVELNGYIKITDLGFCKIVKTRTYTLCGTPEYLAPEIILSKGYGKSVDWWAVGVFIFEMIAGYTPFYADDDIQIYENITIGKYQFTADFTSDARDLVKNMLRLDVTQRFGILKNGVYDIKSHDWFKIIDWNIILQQKMPAPYIPRCVPPEEMGDSHYVLKIEQSKVEKYVKEYEEF